MKTDSLVLGMGGISGSGKTHFLRALKAEFGDRISAISLDDYYKPFDTQIEDENGYKNFDLPSALDHELFSQHLKQLLSGNPVEHRKYQFENFDATEKKISIAPAEIIIAEGLFVFSYPKVDETLQKRIFINTDLNLSLNRRLQRDEFERGIPQTRSLYQWQNHVLPAYQEFIEPHKEKCDLILNGDEQTNVNLKIFRSFMEL